MANRYVDVTITRQTQALTRQGFGTPLILAIEKVAKYKEYVDISAIGSDFGESTGTYKVAQALFGQSPRPAKVAIVGLSFEEGTTDVSALADLLNTTRLSDDGWYYLLSPAHADTTITALSAWAAANGKFYFTSTSSKTLANTLNSERTAVIVHPKPETYPGAAWVGVGAPKDIGSFTWTFKTLNGIEPSGYNTTDVNTIETNKASTYIREGGVNITSKGQTTSGEYIDIVQGQDFIASRLTESVFGLLVKTDKVPYTPQGIALIVAEVEKVLLEAFGMGIIAADAEGKPMYTVEMPDITQISQQNKATRTLPNIKWTATVAGAIEDVGMVGTLVL